MSENKLGDILDRPVLESSMKRSRLAAFVKGAILAGAVLLGVAACDGSAAGAGNGGHGHGAESEYGNAPVPPGGELVSRPGEEIYVDGGNLNPGGNTPGQGGSGGTCFF